MDDAARVIVARFVQRYVAATSDGQVPSGRFVFVAGPTVRKAREVRAPVPWGDVEPTIVAVVERVEDILAAREGHVWLRAYYKGDDAHSGQIRIEGQTDPGTLPDVDGSSDSMAGAMVRTNEMLCRMVTDRDLQLERHHQNQLAAVKTVTHLVLREGIADYALRREALRTAIQEFGPVAAELAPAVAEWLRGRAARPTDPAGRVRQASAELCDAADEMVRVLRENRGVPDGTTRNVREGLDAVAGLAQLLGYRLVPIPPPDPPAGDPPPPDPPAGDPPPPDPPAGDPPPPRRRKG